LSVVTLYGMGTAGIQKDIPPHLLGPEQWSDGNNMRFQDGFFKRAFGYAQVFGTPSVTPGFIFNVPSGTDSFWVYASLTAVYGYNAGTHTDITRAAGATPYTAVNYRDWQGCLLAGVPIFNNGADVPQYWPTIALGTDLAALPNWTATLRAKIIRNFGRFLVALNLNDNGTLLPHAVQWSHPADPGTVPSSWDLADATKDTGRTHLTDTKGGVIVDARLLGNMLVIYKEASIHLMRFIGGQEIMGFDQLLESEGIIGHRCVANIDNGTKHLCLGQNNVYTHSGTKSVEYPLSMKDRRVLYSELDSTNRRNALVFDNAPFEEGWICYPTSGQTYPNKALIWNYRTGTTEFRTFDALSVDLGEYLDALGFTWANVSGTWDTANYPWQNQGTKRIIAASPGSVKIWGLENGFPFGVTANVPAFVQREGIAFGGKDQRGQPKADYQMRKLFKRIWPKIRGNATVQVRLGAQEELDSAVNWAPYQTFVPTQRYLDFEVNGRLGAVEIFSTSDAAWQVEGYDLEVQPLGEN
jgi:hypothetical protein